jgi:hypothetical protein
MTLGGADAEVIATMKMRVTLDFVVGIPLARITRSGEGCFELEWTLREETIVVQVSRPGLERLWIVLSLRLASLRSPGQPPLPGSEN